MQKTAASIIRSCSGVLDENKELKANAEKCKRLEKEAQEKLMMAEHTENLLREQLSAAKK